MNIGNPLPARKIAAIIKYMKMQPIPACIWSDMTDGENGDIRTQLGEMTPATLYDVFYESGTILSYAHWMSAWNPIRICDNHSNDNQRQFSYRESRLFAPLPAHSTRGTGRLWRSSESGRIGRVSVKGHSHISGKRHAFVYGGRREEDDGELQDRSDRDDGHRDGIRRPLVGMHID